MHALRQSAPILGIARPLTPWLFWSGVALIVLGSVAGLFIAPADYLQGDSFRIIYIHVPTAWLCTGGWTGMAIAAIVQLVWRHPLAAIAGRAIAAPGTLFTAIYACQRLHLGPPDLGHMVGVGRPHDLGPHPAFPLSRLHGARTRQRRQ